MIATRYATGELEVGELAMRSCSLLAAGSRLIHGDDQIEASSLSGERAVFSVFI
jgi:hypothetical protein